MVLIRISLLATDVEHFFHISVGHLYVFLENCLFRSSAQFLTGLFLDVVVSCVSSSHISDISPLLDVLFANVFSYYVGCLFVLFVSFAV